jgi:hypothetical protein
MIMTMSMTMTAEAIPVAAVTALAMVAAALAVVAAALVVVPPLVQRDNGTRNPDYLTNARESPTMTLFGGSFCYPQVVQVP